MECDSNQAQNILLFQLTWFIHLKPIVVCQQSGQVLQWLEYCTVNIQVVSLNPTHSCVCKILPQAVSPWLYVPRVTSIVVKHSNQVLLLAGFQSIFIIHSGIIYNVRTALDDICYDLTKIRIKVITYQYFPQLVDLLSSSTVKSVRITYILEFIAHYYYL